jgi:hypothetical protein
LKIGNQIRSFSNVDQNFSNSQNDLWALLANPADHAHLYTHSLKGLVDDFPQSGILQALLALSSQEKNLQQASVYFDPKALFKLINAPSSFIGVSDEKIIIQTSLRGNSYRPDGEYPTETEKAEAGQYQNTDHNGSENYFNEQPGVETDAENQLQAADQDVAPREEIEPALNNHQEIGNHLTEPVFTLEGPVESPLTEADTSLSEPAANIVNNINEELSGENTVPETHTSLLSEPENEIANNAAEAPSVENTVIEEYEHLSAHTGPVLQGPVIISNGNGETTETIGEISTENLNTESAHNHFEVEEKQPEHDIEDETYDEIVGIESIDLEQVAKPAETIEQESNAQAEKPGTDVKEPDEENNKAKATLSGEAEQYDVSRYNDDKMPYSFLWWLDKTRKEHAGVFQPYVKTELISSVNGIKKTADELQQQYFENIFHITSIDQLEKTTAPLARSETFNHKSKEKEIIERFIEEEPQIRPQSSDKLDNENKAKKSSEDRDELVTETLAAIYTDQMLYHKAIAAYKKLMLKFPEKSRYFAGKIEQLEKKTN